MLPFRTTIPVRRFGPATLGLLTAALAWLVVRPGDWAVCLVSAWFVYVFMPPIEERLGTPTMVVLVGLVLVATAATMPRLVLPAAATAVSGAHLALFWSVRVVAYVPFFHLFWPVVEVPSVVFVVAWAMAAPWLLPVGTGPATSYATVAALAAVGFALAELSERYRAWRRNGEAKRWSER